MSVDGKDTALSVEQMLTLASVLDLIIPASVDGRLPAAGQIGLEVYVGEHAADALPIIEAGLAGLDSIAGERGACGFVALSSADRTEVLAQIEASEAAFLPTVIFHAYIGYYLDPRVVQALGLTPGPPYPGGYEVDASDLSILDPVRRRPKLYRK